MLDTPTIEVTVLEAVRSTIGGGNLSRVLVEPTTDSWGDDALNVKIVVHDADAISGDDAVDTIGTIDQALQRIGDHGVAIVSFATEAEMTRNGDTEF